MSENDTLLKDFIEEFFDFKTLCDIGFFKPELKHDYQAQANRICEFFGFETIYEYGAIEVTAHISWDENHRDGKPFVHIQKSIYE